MCPRSGNPDADPRKGPGRRSQWNQGHWMAKNGITSWLPGQESAAGMTNAYNTSDRRVTDGLTSIWWFTEGTGTTVEDRATNAKDTDLTIVRGTWAQDATYNNRYFLSGGVYCTAATDELYNAMQSKVTAGVCNEFTIEAWVKPTNVTQEGPARIVTLAETDNGPRSANFMVGQGKWSGQSPKDVYDTRVRVNDIDNDGDNQQTLTGTATTSLQHVVYTVKGEPTGIRSKLYVDGIEKINVELPYTDSTDTSANWINCWSPGYNLNVGDSSSVADGSRQWDGGFYLLAMYTRALTSGEITTNYMAGPTTDSVLPVPSCQIDDPVSSTVNADGTPVSIPFSIGGWRATDITCTYTVSGDSNTSGHFTVNKDLTLTIDPGVYANTISITPLTSLSADGNVSATLTSMSTGSPVAGQATYTLTVCSLDKDVVVSGAGDRTLDTAYFTDKLPLTFIMDRPHKYDVSVLDLGLSAAATNVGTYGLTTSTIVIPSGTTNYVTMILSGIDFSSGDYMTVSASQASSISSQASATWPSGAASSDTITITNENIPGRPGPMNTGHSIPDWLLKSPVGEPWWNDSKHLVVSGGTAAQPLVIKGYRFQNVKLSTSTSAADYVNFEDCLFDGSGTTSEYLIGCTTSNKNRNLSLNRCTLRGTTTVWSNGNQAWAGVNLISGPIFKYIGYCNMWEGTGDAIASFQWDDNCIVEGNWIHQLGKGLNSHADGIQTTQQPDDFTLDIKGNYFDMKKPSLYADTTFTTYILNGYAPQVKDGYDATWTNYKANNPIRVVSDQGNVSGTINVTGNWFNGWNTCHIYGSKNNFNGYGNFATVNVSSNYYERDFTGGFIATGGGFSGTGGLNWDRTTETWFDTGESIDEAHTGAVKKWSRVVCEAEGNCPAGTWDPDQLPWYWCGIEVC